MMAPPLAGQGPDIGSILQGLANLLSATGSLSIVASALGAFSVIVVVGSLIQTYLARRFLARSVESEEFEHLLATGKLEEVGEYLYERLGSLSVSQFASSDTQWKRVAQLVERAELVVAEPEGGEPVQPSQETLGSVLDVPVVDTLARARELLEEGDLWNAMGELRRQIEAQLKRLGPQDFDRRPISAGRLLREAIARKFVDERAGRELAFALEVANRGVHGRDIGLTEAYEALRSASYGLQTLIHRRATEGDT